MRVALDTNILAYAEGVNGQDRKDTALLILRDFAEHELMVPAQALGELFVVLTRKAKREAAEALSGGTPRISVSGMDSAEQIRQRSVDELSRFPGVKFKS